jgi:hypothetical protein
MLSNVNSSFQVASTGIVYCLDLKYNGGISLTTELSKLTNVANTSPSGLPISTATQAALDTQNSNLSFAISQKMSNTNPSFVGNLSGNGGFLLDSSNNLRTSGNISCQSMLCTSIKVNNFSLPLFNNGSTAINNATIIPLFITQYSVYNYVEIKINFTVNATTSSLTFNGNTQTDGGGTNLTVQENGETTTVSNAQGTPTYTQNGVLASNIAAYGITNQIRMCITKGSNTLSYGNRNYYSFETTYVQNGVGTGRVVGIGHLDSNSLASLIIKCNGTLLMNTTWNTIHYY